VFELCAAPVHAVHGSRASPKPDPTIASEHVALEGRHPKPDGAAVSCVFRTPARTRSTRVRACACLEEVEPGALVGVHSKGELSCEGGRMSFVLDSSFKGSRAPMARCRRARSPPGWNVLGRRPALPLALIKREALAHNIAWMQQQVRAWGIEPRNARQDDDVAAAVFAASSTPARGA